MHLCFDRKNPANWFEFLLWHENSNKFIWICVLTKEINLINIYMLLFDSKNPENWVEISDLTGKIKWIHLHLCFDRKNPANWFEFLLWHVNSKKIFEFVFWQRKSIWLIFTGYFIIFFQIKFAFWQKKSRKLSWILCFDR